MARPLPISTYRFVYKDDHNIEAPQKLLFSDYLNKKSLPQIDLRGFRLHKQIFHCLSEPEFTLVQLNLDYCTNFQPSWFQSLRGKLSLRSLSLEGQNFEMDRSFVSTITTCTNLITINLKKNKFFPESFKDFTRLLSLKSLNLCHCQGIDDYVLVTFSDLCKLGRSLEKIDLSGSGPFQNESLIEFIQSGMNHLKEIRIKNCSQLTSLGLSGLNVKMDTLEVLNVSNLHLTVSVYSWITMGCRRLTSFSSASNESLNDAALGLIGKNCQNLNFIDVSNCLNITDKGWKLFFESYLGNLEFINVNNCYNCGDESVLFFTKQNLLKEIKLNSLSKITDLTLKSLFQLCPSLTNFEMCCELKPVSKSTVSTVPHLSDRSVSQMNCSESLKSFIVAGAIMFGNTGLQLLVNACPSLVKLNLAYCSKINDGGLEMISKSLQRLESLNLNACVHITDIGIYYLCQGKYHLKHLELNGCNKITDKGIKVLAKLFPLLEVLSLRSCDLITDIGIKFLSKYCCRLISLDIANLDYVTLPAVNGLVKYCWRLQSLECAGCSFIFREMNASQQLKLLPFAKPLGGKASLEKRSLAVNKYNHYVIDYYHINQKVKILQKFNSVYLEFKEIIHAKILLQQSRSLKEYYFAQLKNMMEGNLKKRKRYERVRAARCLQRNMKKWYNVRLAKRKLRFLRRQKYSSIQIQKIYRGYRSRKRTRIRFRKFAKAKRLFLMIVGRYFLVKHARKLREKVIKLQNFIRKCINAWKYNYFRKSIMLLQLKYKSKYSNMRNKFAKEIKQKEIDRMIFLQRDTAIRFIQKNWRSILFNKQMSSFVLYCGLVQYSNYQEAQWYSGVLQRYWRGYNTRLKNHRTNETKQTENKYIVKLQTNWRSYYYSNVYKIRKVYYDRNMLRWKKYGLQLPKLRLGFYVKKVVRLFRLYVFQVRRYRAALKILQWYRYQLWKFDQKKDFLKYQDSCVELIQSYWKAHKYKKSKRNDRARQHMAAFKIYVSASCILCIFVNFSFSFFFFFLQFSSFPSS
jgi:hypothetical protein